MVYLYAQYLLPKIKKATRMSDAPLGNCFEADNNWVKRNETGVAETVTPVFSFCS